MSRVAARRNRAQETREFFEGARPAMPRAAYERVPLTGSARFRLGAKAVIVAVLGLAAVGFSIAGAVFIALAGGGVWATVGLAALIVLPGLGVALSCFWMVRNELADVRAGCALRYTGRVGLGYHSGSGTSSDPSYLLVSFADEPDIRCQRLRMILAAGLPDGGWADDTMTVSFTPKARELVELVWPARNVAVRL